MGGVVGTTATPTPAGLAHAVAATSLTAIVVPHTHWDREWYAPFETLRFSLVRFFDELLDVLESDPALPMFLLDGQTVILEDYLEIRRGSRVRVEALVRAGRLRPGPFYVQPDEFHVSGEGLVRNLLLGLQVSREFGWVMREGYLPDTFGHVHQLPQILRGFGIPTFYAMRGLGLDPDADGSQFWWASPDGSRVRVEWLTESYSNAAVLTDDPARMSLQHGTLVRYDSLPELLDRLAERSRTGVLLLLNGGDHLRVQESVPAMVQALDAGVASRIELGGLEDFSRLVAERPAPDLVVSGELRYGARHDVFDGILSTRTPMKACAERTEAQLSGVAERLDALATLADGCSASDSLHYAWRELVKNYAHDSICGCSVDEVHEEMAVRLAKVAQVGRAVADDALARLAGRVAPDLPAGSVPVVVVNPSAFPRSGPVDVDVLPDLESPVGRRRYGWIQAAGVDWAGYRLLDAAGRAVACTITPGVGVAVADTLDRRKELRRDRLEFAVVDVPAMGAATYSLVPVDPGPDPVLDGRAPVPDGGTRRTDHALQNDRVRVEFSPDGTLAVSSTDDGRTYAGLVELLDDGDAGDEYGAGPLLGDTPRSSRAGRWDVGPGPTPDSLVARATLAVPVALTDDRSARSGEEVELLIVLEVRLPPGSDRVDLALTVDNRARDHRIRLRFPVSDERGGAGLHTLAESAYGVVRRDGKLPDSTGWREPPSGLYPLRRFVAAEPMPGEGGLQILTEGLHEYSCLDGSLEVTLLRAVGWLARTDHPLRPHKVGPELATPGAQCPGPHTFRLGIRPYAAGAHVGTLYRAAEEFSVPLQANAVQGYRRTAAGLPLQLGLEVAPPDVVLSAVKTAEDGDGVIVRVFNSAETPVEAVLRPAFPLAAAHRCDLEEQVQEPVALGAAGEARLRLTAGQIATVRLQVDAVSAVSAVDVQAEREEAEPGDERGQ